MFGHHCRRQWTFQLKKINGLQTHYDMKHYDVSNYDHESRNMKTMEKGWGGTRN